MTFLYTGTRLRQPVRLPRPGETATGIMVMAWVLAIVAFLACATQYMSAMRQHHLLHRLPPHPITPVTDACSVVIFVTILIVARSHGWPVRLASAAVGAMAAPMIFEFPFDLIVMARTYPPIPPDPVMYRVLFFAPLFLVEFATLSFLTFAPMVRLTRATVFSFALMLAVFAAWALSGFAFPPHQAPSRSMCCPRSWPSPRHSRCSSRSEARPARARPQCLRRSPQPGHRRLPPRRVRQHRPRPPLLRPQRPAHPHPSTDTPETGTGNTRRTQLHNTNRAAEPALNSTLNRLRRPT
jgi:hypothetical protein